MSASNMVGADGREPLPQSSFYMTAIAAALVLSFALAPVAWTGNEINYFDLAWRFVSPDRFGPNHAVFDQSMARFLSFSLLGGLIKILGFEGALITTRILLIAGYALTFAYVMRCWRLSAIEATAALVLFLLVKQNYFAGEWLFDGVEAKTLAYVAILGCIGLAWQGRVIAAIFLAAVGTYFHFLVGGFWAAAVIFLIGLQTRSVVRVGQLLLLYSVLISPLLGVLVYERFLLLAPDLSDLRSAPNEIYSAFRTPHHVAPFLNVEQIRIWLPGISWMLAVTGLLIFGARQRDPEIRLLSLWLLGLHAYLVVAFALAFLDRHTHALGPLYLFRPNSLILLLTLAFGILWLRQVSSGNTARWLAPITLAAAFAFAVPKAAAIGYSVVVSPRVPLEKTLKPKDRELVDWIRRNTDRTAVVVMQRGPDTDWAFPWVAVERLLDRPTLVSFKFVPTLKAEIARWYRLLQWREAAFTGDCAKLAEQPVDYLIMIDKATASRMEKCGDVVWSNDAYGVLRVSKARN